MKYSALALSVQERAELVHVIITSIDFINDVEYAKELRIFSNTKRSDNFRISNEEIDKIKKIKIETPTSHTIVISGLFNLMSIVITGFN